MKQLRCSFVLQICALILLCQFVIPPWALAHPSHVYGSTWYKANLKKVIACGKRIPLSATYHTGRRGTQKSDAFMDKCAPAWREVVAMNRAHMSSKYLYRTTAVALYRLFAKNYATAPERINGRLLEIHGKVRSVSTAGDGNPSVTLYDGQTNPMILWFPLESRKEVALLSPGEPAVFTCDAGVGYNGKRISLGPDCSIYRLGR